jgi:hypothetical protein
MGKLAKRYTCMDCGAVHEFPADVFTHWNIPIPHVCTCGTSYTILQGDVYVLPTFMYTEIPDDDGPRPVRA